MIKQAPESTNHCFYSFRRMVGDIDARDDPQLCRIVSDKALSIGGGVLEAILSKPELRLQMWA